MKGQLPGQRQPTQWTATSASAAVVNEVRVRCVGHADADAQADAQADAARADTQADAHGVPYSTSPDTLPRPPPFARHGCCFVPHGDEGGTRAHRRLVPAFSVWGRNGGEADGGEADGGEASAAPAWRRICGSGPTAGGTNGLSHARYAVWVDVSEKDVSAFFGKASGCGGSEAAASARYQCYFIFQSTIHCNLR